MKKIIRLLILSAVSLHTLSSWATECRVNSGASFGVHGAAYTTIAVIPIPSLGQVYTYGDLKLECRFEGSGNTSRRDFIKTRYDSLSLPFGGNFTGGLVLASGIKDMPIPADLILATLPDANGGPWTKVDLTPYITAVNSPQSLNVSGSVALRRRQVICCFFCNVAY
ncbi:hypothetical protein KGP26_28520 (plasmid) [Serratia sp. JSRIV002]|uniref:hypothetical protein n=1 Tax=Serratia sp. JSRIV002 TaxID=2831894 RepID=UPI001CC05976|nr:hypothetical protein [Serratia sp. JSRIV002]UAN54542.1 hypothetical protein KGP26_28520 [Serratia sp. JSRIV002]